MNQSGPKLDLEESNRKEQFIMEEYHAQVQLTIHADELRNQVTGFFLTFVGLALAGLALLFQNNPANQVSNLVLSQPEGPITVLLLIIAIIGIAVICILARLRRTQIESFRIINNIRSNFLKDDYPLWNIVQLSEKTIPRPSMKSGTYFWLFIIVLTSSALFATAGYIVFFRLLKMIPRDYDCLLFVTIMGIWIIIENIIYFSMAAPPKPIVYSEENPPNLTV